MCICPSGADPFLGAGNLILLILSISVSRSEISLSAYFSALLAVSPMLDSHSLSGRMLSRRIPENCLTSL